MIDDTRVSSLFSRWQESRHQGREVAPEALCADCPECLPELRQRIQAALSENPAEPKTRSTIPIPSPAPAVETPRGEPFTVADPAVLPTLGMPAVPVPNGYAAAPQVPGHEILGLLGHGGMGDVYRARHLRLGREVALKVVRASYLGSPEVVERFLREAVAVAQLRHQHIVPVYDIGETPVGPYFTMALVDGGNLAQHRKRLRGDARAVATILEKVARAMQHVHDQGIVHRDLKPGNILLDRSGEPAVCDFGLAKITQAAGEHTPSGNVMGTIAYLSPEQATGSSRQVQPSSDLWALGVILYELLTGARPFTGDSVPELLRRIQYDAPPLPRTLEPGLDPDLERIVLRCLAKEPADRYASAGELADDLARWLHGEPVTAPLDSWSRKLRRRWKRRPLLWVAGGICLVALALTPLVWHLMTPSEPVDSRQAAKDKDTSLEKLTPLERIQHRLKAGQAVELIAAKGTPAWSQWAVGLGKAGIHRAKNDGALAVESVDSVALYELLPHVEVDKYRLEAVLRHDEGGLDSCIGLYYCRSELPQGTGRHYFIALTFTEAGAAVGKFEQAVRYLLDPALGKGGATHTLGVNQPFVPFAADQRDYRRLAVEVRPENLKVFWDDQLVREVPRADVDVRIKILKDRPVKLATPPALSPHEGLGLYVQLGTASVQSVTIKPLRQ